MIKPRQTSVVILITLAELAWLAAFGLLFAYRSKVGELGNMRRDLGIASTRLAQWESSAPDAAALLKKLELANTEIGKLQEGLLAFEKLLRNKSPEEAARLLAEAEGVENRLIAIEKEAKDLKLALREQEQKATQALRELRAATNELVSLQLQTAQFPPNVGELSSLWQKATNRVAMLERELSLTQTTNTQLSVTLRQREVGEFSVRRELTGLPDGDLRRVAFVVDTSSSMRNSPAWESARSLMRTWMEYLSVEECVLVNFNDNASVFPLKDYLRVRDTDGTPLPGKRQELLAVFDQAPLGVYSDLLKGLKVAYSFPRPDVIVMFTDGHPHVATRGDSTYAAEILKEVAKHPGIPILTVAVGSYEIEGAGGPRERPNPAIGFLKRLAGTSGGSFIAR